MLGGLGALAGSLWLPAGALLLWLAWTFTTLLEAIVHWTAALPYAALAIDGMAAEAIAAYYAALLGIMWWLRRPVVAETAAPRTSAPFRRPFS